MVIFNEELPVPSDIETGKLHHLKLYKTRGVTQDFVLRLLKQNPKLKTLDIGYQRDFQLDTLIEYLPNKMENLSLDGTTIDGLEPIKKILNKCPVENLTLTTDDEQLIQEISKLKPQLKVENVDDGSLKIENSEIHIPENDIQILDQRIGGSAFGKVFVGVWLQTTKVALKMLKNDSALESFNREARSLAKFRHPRIVLFLGIWKRKYMVLEYHSDGDLKNLLKSGVISSTNTLTKFGIDICSGVSKSFFL